MDQEERKLEEGLVEDRPLRASSEAAAPRQGTLTVVVCTYQRPELLRKCLNSLYGQTMRPDEIVVVVVRGDSATEQLLTEFAPKEPPPNLVWQPGKLGLSNARNLGWSSAHREWVAFIDDDGEADPRWVETFSHRLTAEVSAFGGQVRDPDTDRVVIDGVFPYPLGRVHLCPAGCNMVFRRIWLNDVGGFDENLVYGFDDHDIGIKITQTGARLEKVSDAVVWHRRSWGPDHTGHGPNLPQYAWSGAYLIAKTSRTLHLSRADHFVALSRLINELLAIGHPTGERIGSWVVRHPRETIRTWIRIGVQLARGTRRGWAVAREWSPRGPYERTVG